MRPAFSIATITVLSIAALLSPTAQAGHDEDFTIGRSADGQILVEAADEIVPLPPVSGLLNGWAVADPGFKTLEADEPDNGIFVLESGAQMVFELIAIDPAFQLYTPGLSETLNIPDDTWTIGITPFDEHPTWHINSDDPAFDPGQSVWNVTFRIIDTGSTSYTPSDPLVASFMQGCGDNTDCDDGLICTVDVCDAKAACDHSPAIFGDLAGQGGSCGPDGTVNIFDIFAVLDAFQGVSSCAAP